MKQYEELSRLHIEEAIQAGLTSQAVHRALSEKKRRTPLDSLGDAKRLTSHPSGRLNWLLLLFNIIGKFMGG